MWTLDEIVALLSAHNQRATYGAIAGILHRSAQGLMNGRVHSLQDSWVVAKHTHRQRSSRRGCPTGYADHEIDPACQEQIGNELELPDFISDPIELEEWLNARLR